MAGFAAAAGAAAKTVFVTSKRIAGVCGTETAAAGWGVCIAG